MKQADRFTGLQLSAADREKLREIRADGEKLSARLWRRVRVLELLDEGLTVAATAKAVGSHGRETSRVGKRYLRGGLELALTDDPRPKPAPMLDSTQEAAIVAMVCGPAPDGCARWTTALVAVESVRRGIAPKLGRETARVVLAEHGLKPWREKNVVRAGDRRRVRRAHGGRADALRTPLR